MINLWALQVGVFIDWKSLHDLIIEWIVKIIRNHSRRFCIRFLICSCSRIIHFTFSILHKLILTWTFIHNNLLSVVLLSQRSHFLELFLRSLQPRLLSFLRINSSTSDELYDRLHESYLIALDLHEDASK